jgi:hypothetical protein
MLSPLSSSSSSCSSSSSSVNRTSVRCYLIVVSIFLSVIIEMLNICHIYIYIYIYIYLWPSLCLLLGNICSETLPIFE